MTTVPGYCLIPREDQMAAITKAFERAALLAELSIRNWLTTEDAAIYLGTHPAQVQRQYPQWAAKWGVKVRRRFGTDGGWVLLNRVSLDRMVEKHWHGDRKEMPRREAMGVATDSARRGAPTKTEEVNR